MIFFAELLYFVPLRQITVNGKGLLLYVIEER